MENFADRLKDEIKIKNLRIKEVADEANVGFAALNSYLHNEVSPSAENAVALAQALNTTAEYLITGKKPDEREKIKYYPFRKILESLEQLTVPSIQVVEQTAMRLAELEKNIFKK